MQRVDKCKWYWSPSTPSFYETTCGWMGTLHNRQHKPHSCEKCKRPAEHLSGELAAPETGGVE